MEPINVRNSGWVELTKFNDGSDGNLVILEELRSIPFEIKRVYYINNLENCVSVRGHHAHRELWQVIFCISGSFNLLLDDGRSRQEIRMFRDNLGVILGPGLWHEMSGFSSGAVLLVAASDYFDEGDYIRDYDEFNAWVTNNS